MIETDQNAVETMKTQIPQFIDKNKALQASMESIQQLQQQHEKEELHDGEMDDPDPQPLSANIWNTPVPENFKSQSLSSFDIKSDHMEHVTAFNIRMAIVRAADSLKCKLLAGTFNDGT